MSTRDTTLDQPILESAKAEFLKCGFERASLKDIATNADVTTGAIYKRYKGKEELFCAVVEKCVSQLNVVFASKASADYSAFSDEALKKSWEMRPESMQWWFDLLLDFRDEYVLLLSCSAGTKYETFAHDWVEIMTRETYRCYEEMFSRGLTSVVMSKKELHTLLSACWTTIYEPFIHGFSAEEIQQHCGFVCRMINWEKVFDI